jgi:replicative DNA helicase
MAKPGRKIVKRKFVPRNEQIVLSHMMKNRKAMVKLCAVLSVAMFLEERHRSIFITLRELVERRLEFDLETFEQLATGRKYGGRQYVKKLIEAFDEQKNLDHHVEQMRVDAIKASALQGPLQLLVDLCEDSTVGLAKIRETFHGLNATFSTYSPDKISRGETLGDDYRRRLKQRIKDPGFVSTGIESLDRTLTQGLAAPGISVWTGRTGMGKSTVGWNVADHAANVLALNVIYFSFEMTADAVLDGMVASRTRISLERMVKKTNDLRKNEVKAIAQAIRDITANGKLVFRDRRLKVPQLPSVLSDVRPQLCVFDLWERMVSPPNNEVITDQLAVMQDMAKEFDCHFMILHQQKRATELTDDKRPTLVGLKNSGAYEEYADSVFGLYREWIYDPSVRDVLEIQNLKQRRGQPYGIACVEFDGEHGRIGKEVKGWLEKRSSFL